MPEHPDAISLFGPFLALHREALAAGYYRTAYHALAAALHLAHARQDAEGLPRVLRRANGESLSIRTLPAKTRGTPL
jgi:hypothetical protein